MKRILFFFLLLCQACVREEVIDNLIIPLVPDRLVVYGLLTPGDSVRVNVRLSRSINQENNGAGADYVNGALVRLTNRTTDQTVLLKQTGRNGYYGISQTQFPIRAGHTYAIAVTYSSLSAESQCRVPSKAAVFDSLFATPHLYGGDSVINLRMYWPEVSTPSELLMYFTGRTRYSPITQFEPNGSSIFDINIFDAKEQVKVGQQISYIDPEDVLLPVVKLDYHLFTVEPSVYQFFIEANRMAVLYDLADEQPYETFKGIFPEYTNIKGGLGVFGGYLSHKRTVFFN